MHEARQEHNRQIVHTEISYILQSMHSGCLSGSREPGDNE
jgi:hypothetical protein